MNNLLTDRDFWVKYWESKPGLAFNLPSNYLFHRQLADIVRKSNCKTAIELGGFPGYYAVFLKKYLGLNVTLLDYFIHYPLVEDLLKKNDLQGDDIHIVEADLFQFKPSLQYDLVLSCGLIEHFTNTSDIIDRHIAFLKPGGTLFITLPNFKGLNGWFQKHFDRENYDKHNINCMNLAMLTSIMEHSGLKNVKSYYSGKFGIWLENEKKKSISARLLKQVLRIGGKGFTKIFPFESKSLSPYIIVEAQKTG